MNTPNSSNGRTRSFGLRNVSSTLTLGTIFVLLNILDAILTNYALATGYGLEFNPLTAEYGFNILIKGLLALAVAGLLAFFKKQKMLKILNWCFLGVIIWNIAMIIIIQGVIK